MPTREEIVALMQEDEFSGLRELIRIGANAVLFLRSILNDPSSPPYLQYRATVALGEIRDRSAVGDIQAALASTDPVQKQMSARALAKILGNEAIPILITLIDDADPTVGKVAMQELSKVGDQTTLAILERHQTENPSEILRAQAGVAVKDIRERLQ